MAALDAAVRAAKIPGVGETVPAFASLLVRYDPLATDYDAVAGAVDALAQCLPPPKPDAGRLVTIPVCYGGDFGPDLAFVAKHAGLTEAEVIRRHTGRDYRIYMLGFLPGFPYLGGLDPGLFTPRLQNPRTAIPAGIGGHRRRADRHLPGGVPRRLAADRPHAAGPVRPGTAAPVWPPATRIRFTAITPEQFAKLAEKEGTA